MPAEAAAYEHCRPNDKCLLASLVTLSEHSASVVQLVRVHFVCEAKQRDVHGGNVASWHLTVLLCDSGGGSAELGEGVCLAVRLQY